ncbi:hypothetical protein LDENG_00271800 [Lucifuga dentata]|nr:hypothetical protein LDENG_00271800 [Lucifuga dentata]
MDKTTRRLWIKHRKKEKIDGLPLALIMACICHGIILISLCNVTTFISVQSCINFSPRSCIDDGRVRPLCEVFSSTSFQALIICWTVLNPILVFQQSP